MKFTFGYGEVTQEHTENQEQLLGIKFPNVLKKILFENGEYADGGAPENDCFLVLVSKINNRHIISCFGGMCFFNPKNSQYYLISEINKDFGLPTGVIAFAATGFGDYICFDYREDPKTDNPPLVYYAHEYTDVNDGIFSLAKDFDAFIGMLMSEEDAVASLEKLSS